MRIPVLRSKLRCVDMFSLSESRSVMAANCLTGSCMNGVDMVVGYSKSATKDNVMMIIGRLLVVQKGDLLQRKDFGLCHAL